MASDGKSESKSENDRANQNDKRKEKTVKKTFTRYEPYGRRNKVFVSNIPFDVKWQALKDLIKELVGEVTYVELLTDAEGKSRGCAAVEFKTEENLKKAVTVLNKHNLSGRPLKVKEDLEGEHARRAVQKMFGGIGGTMGGPMGIPGGMAGPMGIGGPLGVGGPNGMGGPLGPGLAGPGVPIPPSILNNPNIANEIIHALQAGRLGSTVFVANLDYSVGWKKLKEVFAMAGVVARTDILEDKEGKSRGIGTVTYEQPIEAVQAISMFNGQLLFDRPMVVKMDDKSMPKGDSFPPERPPQLPRGLAGIGLGLGPGGQPLDAHLLNRGGAMVPGGLDGIGFGMNKMAGLDGPFGGNGAGISLDRSIALDRAIGLDRGIDRFATSGMSMGRLPDNILDVERATGAGFERDFVRSGMAMSGSYGDALDRVMSSGSALSGMDRMSTGLGPGLDRMGAGLGHGLDRVPSDIDRLGLVIDRLGSSGDRMSSSGIDRLGSLGMEAMAPSVERMGHSMDRMSSVERMGSGMGYGVERMGSTLERVASALDRIGSVDRMSSSSIDRMGVGMVSSSMDRMGTGMDRMGQVMDRLSTPVDRMTSGSLGRMGLDRVGASAIDRLGPSMGQPMGSSIDRIGLGMGVGFDRPMDMDRANFGGGFGGTFGGTASGAPVGARKGCQIFVRNLSFDFTWKMLKDKFIECGHVVYADIKMENGKSKGCGVVKFDSPESAERACRLMNGIKLAGREIDVRMDRNA